MCVCINAHEPILASTRMYVCVYTYIHMLPMQPSKCIRADPGIDMYVYMCVYTYIHKYIHTYIHTDIYTYVTYVVFQMHTSRFVRLLAASHSHRCLSLSCRPKHTLYVCRYMYMHMHMCKFINVCVCVYNDYCLHLSAAFHSHRCLSLSYRPKHTLYICVYVCMYSKHTLCVYVCIYMCMHKSVFVTLGQLLCKSHYDHVCMYVCMYVCMCNQVTLHS